MQTKVYNFCRPEYGGSGLAKNWIDVVKQEKALREHMRIMGQLTGPEKRARNW